MPLRLQPDPRELDWYTLHSGEAHVGILRIDAQSWREAFWFFSINIVHQNMAGARTGGSAKTRDVCLERAQQCWAEQIAALGLREV
jgi:hypothetical protein